MDLLLIVVLAIIIINALIGMKTGFIKTIFSLCSMIVAVILTIWLNPYVNDFLRDNEKITNAVSSKVEAMVDLSEEKAEEAQQSETDTIEEESQNRIIEGLHLPKSIKQSLLENNNVEAYKDLAVNNFKEYVVDYITGVIINAAAFAITFIVILALLWIVSIALDLISKLPLLNQINKTAGLLAGLVHGLVIVWIFFILLTVFGSTDAGQKALQAIGENQILSFIYNNNYLLRFITGITKMVL